jgi:thiamine biosynthesis protein ThiS
LIDELNLPSATLLIEHNGNALRRNEWPTQDLGEGDRVELLRIAAGG